MDDGGAVPVGDGLAVGLDVPVLVIVGEGTTVPIAPSVPVGVGVTVGVSVGVAWAISSISVPAPNDPVSGL